MKKALAFLLCAIGFILIAAPTAVETPVLLNGKQFGNAIVQGGIIAVSLADFARAGGSGPSLEPGFQLKGNTLLGIAAQAAVGDKLSPGASQAKNYAKNFAPGQLFHVAKSGPISTRVFMVNGKAYIPLADVAKSFGGTFNQGGGTLRPGQSIELNFSHNSNALISAYAEN